MADLMYMGIEGRQPLHLANQQGETLCGAEIAAGAGVLSFPRIDPERARQRYDICFACEPPVACVICGARDQTLDDFGQCKDRVACEYRFDAKDSSPDAISERELSREVAATVALAQEDEPEQATVHDHMVRAAYGYKRYQRNHRDAIQAYLECGRALLEAREVAEHGTWLPLLDEFEIPQRTAQNMMRLAREYSDDADAVIEAGGIRAALLGLGETKNETVSHLPETPDEELDEFFTENNSELEPDTQIMGHTPDELVEELDDLESENLELRQEVQELKERPPTRTQKLEAQVEALSLEVTALKTEKADLQMRVEWFEAQESDYDQDHYKRINQQQAEIRTLNGRLNRLTNEREEARRQVRYWRSEAMKMGWKEAQENPQPELRAR